MGIIHFMGLGRSPGVVTCPLAYLNYLYQSSEPRHKKLFSASGEFGQESGQGNFESMVLFTTDEVRKGEAKGLSFDFIDNALWQMGGQKREKEPLPDVICDFLKKEFHDFEKKLIIYWCQLELDDPNQALERITRVLLAFSPTGKQGKEIWANLTGGNNVINSTLFWVGYLSGKISRYYYINAQFPNNKFLRPFIKKEIVMTEKDTYWVSFPNLKMSFDINYYAVLEEILTNPKSPMTTEVLLSCLKNSAYGEYFQNFTDETIFGRTVLLHMMGNLLDREFYETTGTLRVNAQGQHIHDMISNDLMKRLILPTSEQEDEGGRQKVLLATGWFFEQHISI